MAYSNCPLCPKETFPALKNFVTHVSVKHGKQIKELSCIFCDFSTRSFHKLTRHQKNCFPALVEDSPTKCEFCPTLFYFGKFKSNPFHTAHLNNRHNPSQLEGWKKCHMCPLWVPSMTPHRLLYCIMRAKNVAVKGFEPPVHKLVEISEPESVETAGNEKPNSIEIYEPLNAQG